MLPSLTLGSLPAGDARYFSMADASRTGCLSPRLPIMEKPMDNPDSVTGGGVASDMALPSDRATQASPEPASSLGHSVSVPSAWLYTRKPDAWPPAPNVLAAVRWASDDPARPFWDETPLFAGSNS